MPETQSKTATVGSHTPGPWQLGSSKVAIWGSDGSVVADAWESNDRPDKECEANARLIAAAPDLLAALKSARHGLEAAGMGCSRVIAAINKAEGR